MDAGAALQLADPLRRALLRALGVCAGAAAMGAHAERAVTEAVQTADPVRRGRPLVFPRDHGAHPASRIEWWYITGWLVPTTSDGGAGSGVAPVATAGPSASPDPDTPGLTGFQVTFFRSRTGLAQTLPGRFAPRQILFAHAAVSEIAARRHLHAERIARWSGDPQASHRARAALHDADLTLGGWTLQRQSTGTGPLDARWRTDVVGDGFAFDLTMARTQPLLLQGDAGYSRKGPDEAQASHYLSEPHLTVAGRLERDGRTTAVAGRAWLDQEWSDELLHPQAVGWDWIGMMLDDGSALTAFRLRRADGSALWAGGSVRRAGQTQARALTPDEVRFEPLRWWRSPSSGGRYPVDWQVTTPVGRMSVRALFDTQEMHSRVATGTIYWEGLSSLHDPSGRRIGMGYLEMTGYVGRLEI